MESWEKCLMYILLYLKRPWQSDALHRTWSSRQAEVTLAADTESAFDEVLYQFIFWYRGLNRLVLEQIMRFILTHLHVLDDALQGERTDVPSADVEQKLDWVLQATEEWQTLFLKMGMKIGGKFPTIVDMGAPPSYLPVPTFFMPQLEADLYRDSMDDLERHYVELEAEEERGERDEVEWMLHLS